MVTEAAARKRAEDKAKGIQSEPGGPSLAYWSPELNALAALIDKMSVLIELQKSEPKTPVPYARPKTRLDRLQAQRENAERWEAHKALTARVIRQQPEGA